MNKALSLLLALVIITACIFCGYDINVRAQKGTSVTFPDSNLEAAIREAINKPEGPIYTTDLKSITELHILDRGISDLTGLEHCVNLQDLRAYNNHISDLSPLADLTNLTMLSLGRNQISDLSPLASLTKLRELQLWDNQISDLSPLASLMSLTCLTLYDNQINDISSLTSLTNLEELYLGGNQISDISPLVENSGLSIGDIVFLEDNPLSDISMNAHIPRLAKRGVSIYGLPRSAAAVIDVLHPGILLALVCIVLAVVMLLVPLYHTHGNQRKRDRRDGLISGVIGAGLLTFFLLFTVGFNCRYCLWYIERPEMWSSVVAPGILLFTSVAIAWKWERIGGILLIIEGILSPPLLLSGILFLLSSGEGYTPLTGVRISYWLRRVGLIYVLVVAVVSGPICYWVIDEYVRGMAMLGPTFALMLAWLLLIPGIVIAGRGRKRGGGILIIVAGLLTLLGALGGQDCCLPIHLFFITTLPLLVSGAFFLLSLREGREYPNNSQVLSEIK